MKTSMTYRVIAALLLIALLPLLLLQWMSIARFEQGLREQLVSNLANIADKKVEQIESYLSGQVKQIELLALSPQLLNDFQNFDRLYASGVNSPAYLQWDAQQRPWYQRYIQQAENYDLFLINAQGDVVFSVRHESDFARNLQRGSLKEGELAQVVNSVLNKKISAFSEFSAHYLPSGKPAIFLATPLMLDQRVVGVLAVQIDHHHFATIAQSSIGLGQKAHTLLVRQQQQSLISLFHEPPLVLPLANAQPLAVQLAMQGQPGAGAVINDEGRAVFSAWRAIPAAHLAMAVEVSQQEALRPVSAMRTQLLQFTLACAGLIVLLGIVIGRHLTQPLLKLNQVALEVSAGNLQQQIKVQGNDEVARLGHSFNLMIQQVRDAQSLLEQRVEARTLELEIANISLASNELFIRTLLDAMPYGVIAVDESGVILSANPAMSQLMGYSVHQLVGESIKDLLQLDCLALWQGKQELMLRHQNGELLPVEVASAEMALGGRRKLVVVMTDLRERKQIEAKIRQYQGNLEGMVAFATAEITALVETAVSGVISIDERGLIRIFNPAAERLFGWKAEEIVGRNVSCLMASNEGESHDKAISHYLHTGEAHVIGRGREVLAKRKDGSFFPAYLAVGHKQLEEGRHLFVAFVSDISVQKENERVLCQAKEDAEAASRAKASFLANMSHEIRTPMNSVIGFAEVCLQDKHLQENTRHHLGIILSAGQHLLGIINDILDFSRAEARKMELERVCFHLPNLLRQIVETLSLRAAEKDLDLQLKLASNLPERVWGDPHRLRQVLLNLLGNAIKFTHRGMVSLEVDYTENQQVHFSIRDSGIGMKEAQLDRLFTPFCQADSSINRNFGGTGLGTVICKQIVEAMYGKIWAESVAGQGSCFHVECQLDIATSSEVHCLYLQSENPATQYRSPRCFKVLLAEDVDTNALLARLRLEQQGHHVTRTCNGQETIAALHQAEYDIVLMDVQMPVMDGLEATRIIRQQGNLMPIIALTASVLKQDQQSCLDAGMNVLVGKPLVIDELLQQMELLVPAGAGVPNHAPVIRESFTLGMDFSPLSGQANLEQALNNWRDEFIYLQALQQFAEQYCQVGQEIQRLLNLPQVALEQAEQLAHTLKGVAGNLALDVVFKQAQALDQALKQQQQAKAEVLAQGLQQALDAVCLAIEQLPELVVNQQDELLTAEQMCDILQQFQQALTHLNPDAAEPLLAQLAPNLSPREWQTLQYALNNFDFSRCQDLATQLLIRLRSQS